MPDRIVTPSAKAIEAFERVNAQWTAAMDAVPAYVRCRLNAHQIQCIPEIAADIKNALKDGEQMLLAGPKDGAPFAYRITAA